MILQDPLEFFHMFTTKEEREARAGEILKTLAGFFDAVAKNESATLNCKEAGKKSEAA